MDGYKQYIRGFITIHDEKIKKTVNDRLLSEALFPDPLIQFNPAFQPGGSISDLITDGALHPDCRDIYTDATGAPWTIYRHQTDAITLGNASKGFVVTSGTGSEKA